MPPRYTASMPPHQTHPAPGRTVQLPLLWLLSDARNDAALEAALHALPSRSGFVFRHYHLDSATRAARFEILAGAARARGHLVALADEAERAHRWGADAVYGPAERISRVDGLLRLGAAHDGDELAGAARAGADAVFLSPVFPSRSHPGAGVLGVHGFHVLAQQSPVPVIALGGMTAARAVELAWPRWGAIDGLASPPAP